jgi:hypothetical protein
LGEDVDGAFLAAGTIAKRDPFKVKKGVGRNWCLQGFGKN